MTDTPVLLAVHHRKAPWRDRERRECASLSKAVDYAVELHRTKDDWRPQEIQSLGGKQLVPKAKLLRTIDGILYPRQKEPKEKRYRLITVREAPMPPLHTEHAELSFALMAAERMRLTVGRSIAIQTIRDNMVVVDEDGIKAAMAAYEQDRRFRTLGSAYEQMEASIPGFGSF